MENKYYLFPISVVLLFVGQWSWPTQMEAIGGYLGITSLINIKKVARKRFYP